MEKVAYSSALPPGSSIHPVFHVTLLKKCIGLLAVTTAALPSSSVTAPSQFRRRLYKKGNVAGVQLLVQWVNQGADRSTLRITMSSLEVSRFSALNLEDKVIL